MHGFGEDMRMGRWVGIINFTEYILLYVYDGGRPSEVGWGIGVERQIWDV